MFWGCFGGLRVGDLHKVVGIMEQNKYHQILVRHAMPSGQRIFGADGHAWWFMHDNDPKHTSNKVKSYLTSKQNDNKSKMKVMEWPSQSPLT